jgi:hypothetical protein
MNKEQELRNVMGPLQLLAEQYKVAIILVGHFNKDKMKDAVQRVVGAQAMLGVVRMAWAFAQVENSPQGKMLPIKANIAKYAGGIEYETTGAAVEIEGKTQEYPKIIWGHAIQDATSVAIGGGKQQDSKLQMAVTFLASYLSKGDTVPAIEVEGMAKAEAWYSKALLDTAVAQLKVKKQNVDGVWKWGLQDNTKALDTSL